MVRVQRDEGEDTLGDLHLGGAKIAMSDDLDADRHRSAADLFDLGIDRDQIAQVDRGDELHRLDRDRSNRALGPPRSDDASRNVHLTKHPATEDMAVGVDIGRPGDDAQNRRSFKIGLSKSSCS